MCNNVYVQLSSNLFIQTGLTISARCKAVIRGGKKHAEVEVMSNAEEVCGVAILMPTCA